MRTRELVRIAEIEQLLPAPWTAMEVREFDDRKVCSSADQPTFMVELWSWEVGERNPLRGLACCTYTLTSCDVLEALAWCREKQPNPGCFVLHAATWTNHGYLETLWLAGEAPQSTGTEQASATATFEALPSLPRSGRRPNG
ncbi:hypothetical protein OU415_24705 [Saccharopolyspora sp. WRP15-2]|uniref:Uncharacterized protein n=1 Tax=Saccharopolyspora oryzae TaxID=2997343 RepID=A0ABT4V3W8_9PSEU|nr:hypothetical protein [Saccharopolyspora oryzae]MDA3628656.1 hypothetical protein [Saccharopolyspora oryzae]